MFQDVSAKLVQNITGGIAVSNLWADVQYDELTINVRQKGDNTFADLLGRVRTGSETANDLKTSGRARHPRRTKGLDRKGGACFPRTCRTH